MFTTKLECSIVLQDTDDKDWPFLATIWINGVSTETKSVMTKESAVNLLIAVLQRYIYTKAIAQCHTKNDQK